jgi:hypothetical protein
MRNLYQVIVKSCKRDFVYAESEEEALRLAVEASGVSEDRGEWAECEVAGGPECE